MAGSQDAQAKARRLPRYLPTLAALLALIALSCSGDQKAASTVTPSASTTTTTAALGLAATGTPATTPVISLTPAAGAPADLTAAQQLEAQGDIENAVEAYIAVAAQTGPDQYTARITAARLLLELNRPADALLILDPYKDSTDAAQDAAHYLLARANAALENWDDSLAQYDAYLHLDGAATPYAYLDRANVLLSLDRPADAAASAESGFNYDLPIGALGAFRVTIAQSYERAGDTAGAIHWWQELAAKGAPNDQAFALSQLIDLKQQTSDPTADDDLLTLLGSFPASSYALDALNDAEDRGETIPPTVSGLVQYRHNEYTAAEPYFQDQIDADPQGKDSAEAYYYLAAIQESRGDIEDALTNYAQATNLNPDSPIADDALWWRARLRLQAGETAAASILLDRITTEYPNSSWAPEAAFEKGMLSYVNHDYGGAAAIWAQANVTSSDQRLSFWQGKALLQAGDDQDGRTVLQALATAHEVDYYGIRALSLLNGDDSQPTATTETNIDFDPNYDWAAAETWLAQKTGRPVEEQGWITDPRWLRATELWTVGRNAQADTEVSDLIDSYDQDPIAMYTMARRLQALGHNGVSGRAGQRLLRTLDTNPNEGLPMALLSLSYPPAFGNEAVQYAKDAGVSPLLLMAFVRQESFFDPRAISPAGAMGLTQLLPDTAQTIAQHFKMDTFDPDLLLHADVSLQFGAYYMAQQLKDFDNEILVAFAAYNGGPTSASRWRQAPGADDPDVYLETIDFSETRLYLQLVGENYAIYRYLYGGEPEPDLPN